ncbi:hypothetical protein E2I00_018325, partial [Balaenoptera physalus]
MNLGTQGPEVFSANYKDCHVLEKDGRSHPRVFVEAVLPNGTVPGGLQAHPPQSEKKFKGSPSAGCSHDNTREGPCYYGNTATVQCFRNSHFVLVVSQETALVCRTLIDLHLARSAPRLPPSQEAGSSVVDRIQHNQLVTNIGIWMGPQGSITWDGTFLTQAGLRAWEEAKAVPGRCHLLISEVTKPQMRQKITGAEALRYSNLDAPILCLLSSILSNLDFRLHIHCVFNASDFLPLQAPLFPPPSSHCDPVQPLRLQLQIDKGKGYTPTEIHEPLSLQTRLSAPTTGRGTTPLWGCFKSLTPWRSGSCRGQTPFWSWCCTSANPFQYPQWPIQSVLHRCHLRPPGHWLLEGPQGTTQKHVYFLCGTSACCPPGLKTYSTTCSSGAAGLFLASEPRGEQGGNDIARSRAWLHHELQPKSSPLGNSFAVGCCPGLRGWRLCGPEPGQAQKLLEGNRSLVKAGVEKLLVMTRQNHSHLRHVRLRVSSVLSELRPLLLGRVQCLPGLNLGDFASPEGKPALQAEKAGQEK